MTECAYNMFNGAVASGYIIELAHLRTLPPNLDFEFASNCWGTPFKVLHLLCLLVRVFQICNKNSPWGQVFSRARQQINEGN